MSEDNFVLFASKHYDSPSCYMMDEFEEDLNRIKYIKRLLRKYDNSQELRERLIINHLIILYNVFEPRACTAMLKFKLSEYLPFLKPFLLYLNVWDDKRDGIIMDENIISALRNL